MSATRTLRAWPLACTGQISNLSKSSRAGRGVSPATRPRGGRSVHSPDLNLPPFLRLATRPDAVAPGGWPPGRRACIAIRGVERAELVAPRELRGPPLLQSRICPPAACAQTGAVREPEGIKKYRHNNNLILTFVNSIITHLRFFTIESNNLILTFMNSIITPLRCM